MEENNSSIKCGCGFTATGPDQATNKAALEAHNCFDADTQVTSWYHAVFSFEGIAVLFVVGWIIVEIVRAAR